MKRPLAYITAAWLGGDSENAELAAQYCRTVYEAGFSPICPPLYLPLFLTPTQARHVHAYYIAGIKQPEISRIEGVHSSKVSVAIRRGLRNMRRCYDGFFQTE